MLKCQGKEQLSYSSPQGITKVIIFCLSLSLHCPLSLSPSLFTLSNILIPPPSLYYPHTSSPRYPRPSTRSPPPVTAWGLKASAAISPNMTQVCPINIATKRYQGYHQIVRWWWQVAKAGCVRTRPGSRGQQRFLWRFHQVEIYSKILWPFAVPFIRLFK